DPDHLPGPAAADPVLEHRQREPPEPGAIHRYGAAAAGCVRRIHAMAATAEDQTNEERHGQPHGRVDSHARFVRTTPAVRYRRRWDSLAAVDAGWGSRFSYR